MSTRTERVGSIAGFTPAILYSQRAPLWYVVRHHQNDELLKRLLNCLGLEYRIYTYRHQVARRPATTRHWLPGYFFIAFDVDLDDWGQLHRIPGVIDVLGSPTPLPVGEVERLDALLPHRLPKNTSETTIPVGTEVVANGVRAKVIRSRAGRVTVLWFMFGQLREQELKTKDVEIFYAAPGSSDLE